MSTEQRACAGIARVRSCESIGKETGVFLLTITAASKLPLAGQFYLLKSRPSDTFLGRPISVFRAYPLPDSSLICIEFLILKKGRGTEQLCALVANSELDIIGPLGNSFEKPHNGTHKNTNSSTHKVALIGGGIGVAPIAGFAETLPPASYDFYGAFRSTPYGLDYIRPENRYLCTDDGSSGVKGMLPSIFGTAQAAPYAAVYACGPDAMLAYIQKTCIEADVPSYLSTEAHMACGVGACLGCTVKTVHGNKRCCKDGPVFVGAELIFHKKA